MDKVLYYHYDEKDPKDIDEYVEKLVYEISYFFTYFDCCINWYNNKWLPALNKRRKKYNDCEDAIEILGRRNYFFRTFNFQPKRYEYFVYVRAFLDVLKIYLKKNTIEYKNNIEIWESSKYLKYYVHLIFKTGFYKKIFATDEEILEELKILNSFLSKPLHGFSIYYRGLNNFNTITLEDIGEENKEIFGYINQIVYITLRFWVNESTIIKYPIDPNIEGNKQEYLKYTSYLKTDASLIIDNLNFLKDKCLEEFDKKVEELRCNIKK